MNSNPARRWREQRGGGGKDREGSHRQGTRGGGARRAVRTTGGWPPVSATPRDQQPSTSCHNRSTSPNNRSSSPVGFDCAHNRRTPRPSVEGISRKALLLFGAQQRTSRFHTRDACGAAAVSSSNTAAVSTKEGHYHQPPEANHIEVLANIDFPCRAHF